MTYKKPQSPIMNGTDGIYPLTTADQIIKANGSRLEQGGKIIADNSTTADNANNANMLANKAPEAYVLHNDALSLEEIEASTNLDNKVASAEAAKGLVDRLGYIKHVAEFTLDTNQGTSFILPSKYHMYILIAGHIVFGSNNGMYMLIYHDDSRAVRTISLSGNWSAEITGDVNGKVQIKTDNTAGCRGDVYMVAHTV